MLENFTKEPCHISALRIGDTVLHEGKAVTVSKGNLKNSQGMGLTFRGDSYRLGTMPVVRLVVANAELKGRPLADGPV